MEHKSSRAFFTARVDEDGKEIGIRETVSTAELSPDLRTLGMLPASGRSKTSQLTSRRSSSTTRSIKYNSPVVQVEDLRSHVGDRSAFGSSNDIVPPLDLQSVCYSSPREGGYTFYYNNYCEAAKLKGNPSLAYENWLSAKRRIISDKAAKRKREEEAKQREKENRKRLAAEEYQKWLESKQQQERLKQKSQSKKAGPQKQRAESKPPADARKEKIEEWERNKRLEEENRRKMKRLEKEKCEREEEKRRQLAQEAWGKWISEAPNKPKPVPLNRGLFTLRGTISDIFINPNEWKSGDGL